MTDIVERLRRWASENWQAKVAKDVVEAAAEIERLRIGGADLVDEIERLRAMQARWTAADHANMTQATATKEAT